MMAVSFFSPSIASPHKMVSNANTFVITILALLALPSGIFASVCRDKEEICINACREFYNGFKAGLCLVGCKLAYLACKFFLKR
jgi:hypothetical protein